MSSAASGETQSLTDRHRECHELFDLSDYERQKNINSAAVPGTCNWVLNHARYLQWLASSEPDLLWVSANPGCVLGRENIKDMPLTPVTTCYFFFKDNDEQNSLATALCAILHQLFKEQRELLSHALHLFEQRGKSILNSVDELWQILISAANDPQARPTICVLDALDECRDVGCQSLIDRLVDFDDKTRSGLNKHSQMKWLVTSRPYGIVRQCFSKISRGLSSIHLHGEIKEDQMQGEIDLIVRKHLEDLSKQFRLSQEQTLAVTQMLRGSKTRTHLWVYLVITALKENLEAEVPEYRIGLQRPPASMDGVYGKALERVTSEEAPRSMRVLLAILAGVNRPLTSNEMILALAITRKIPQFVQALSDLDLDNPVHDVSNTIRCRGSAFVFTKDERIHFTHQTAKEFLLRRSDKWNYEPGPPKNKYRPHQHIQLLMARICMTFLCTSDFDSAYRPKNEDQLSAGTAAWLSNKDEHHADDGDGENPQYSPRIKEFFVFAALRWAGYARAVEEQLDDDMRLCTQHLYDTKSIRFRRWARLLSGSDKALLRHRGDYVEENIRYSASTGHSQALQYFLDLEPDIMSLENDKGMSILALAAQEGHEAAVRVLLDHGAYNNTQKSSVGKGPDPLYAASCKGYVGVIQALLDESAGVDMDITVVNRALQIAAANGHADVVRMLQSHSAKSKPSEHTHHLDASGISGAKCLNASAALYNALDRGHLEVAQIFLDGDTDINTEAGHHGYALSIASQRGHLDMVRALLDKGADINAQGGGRYNSALHVASGEGRTDIVSILLRNGAKVDSPGGHYNQSATTTHTESSNVHGNALHAAISRSHIEVVKLLLDHGADVNAPGGKDLRVPLHVALAENCFLDQERTIKLNAGTEDEVDLHINQFEPTIGPTNVEIILALLEYGANVNAGDSFALSEAVRRNSPVVVEALLNMGARVNRAGDKHGDALYAASHRGDREMAQTLLDHGADVNAQSGLDGNALAAASAEQHLEVVRMLIDHGAKVNAQGGAFGNALQAASAGSFRMQNQQRLQEAGGHVELVRTLLSHGADVNAQGGSYGTALQAASARGHAKVVKTLLDHGADVEAAGGRFGSAIQAAAFGGFREVVQMLLDHGATASVQGGEYGTPLQAATQEWTGGSVGGMKVLLENDADVNVQGGHFGNALQAAASSFAKESLEKVRLLLDKGAQVNAQGGEFGNALQAAAAGGRPEVVQLLLERGAEVNAQGGEYGTALQAAAKGYPYYFGHTIEEAEAFITKANILIDHGADVNSQGGKYGSALLASLVAQSRYSEMVKTLVENGADVNARDAQYGTAFEAARKFHMDNVLKEVMGYKELPLPLS